MPSLDHAVSFPIVPLLRSHGAGIAIGFLLLVMPVTIMQAQPGPVIDAGVGYTYGSIQHDIDRQDASLAFPNADEMQTTSWTLLLGGGWQFADDGRLWCHLSVSDMTTTQYAQRSVPLVIDGASTTGELEQQYTVDAQRWHVLTGVEIDVLPLLFVRTQLGAGWYSSSIADVNEQILEPETVVFKETGTRSRPAYGSYAVSGSHVHLLAGAAVGIPLQLSEHVMLVPSASATLAITDAVSSNGWRPWTLQVGVSIQYRPSRPEFVPLAEVDRVQSVDTIREPPATMIPADTNSSMALLSCIIDLQPLHGDTTSLLYVARLRVIAHESVETKVFVRAGDVLIDQLTSTDDSIDVPIDVARIISERFDQNSGVITVSSRSISASGVTCDPLPSQLKWRRDDDGTIHLNDRP